MSLNVKKIENFNRQFFKEFTLLYNPEKHCFLPIRKCAEKYSMYRFSKRLEACKTEFNYFATLTFSPEAEKSCKGYIILPTEHIKQVPVQGIDRDGFQHIYQNISLVSYINEPIIQHFTYIPLRMVTNQLLRRALDLLRKREFRRTPHKIEFVWRFERGSKGGREHYHLLIKSNMCKVCMYFLLKEIWPYGFVDLKIMYNKATIKAYVTKYFTKHTSKNNLRVMSMKRRWSFSKNCEFGPIVKDPDKPTWIYYGEIHGEKTAKQYFISTLETFLEDYPIEFAIKIHSDIEQESLKYISRTPYKARYERLKKSVREYTKRNLEYFIKKDIL